MTTSIHRARWHQAAVAAALALVSVAEAQAQFKVVGPDGKVTYTDRSSTAAPGATGPGGPAALPSAAVPTPTAALPLALRQPMARYPVVLYAQPSCEGCEAGRQFLRARGIPYSEKLVGNEDGEALQRATGGRAVPALTIGQQVLRGFSADNWASYLDAAGYPKQSALPANYVAEPPRPLVPPRPVSPDAATPTPDTTPPPPVPPPAPGPGGIRF
jgi:glutaredoxin